MKTPEIQTNPSIETADRWDEISEKSNNDKID